MILLLVASLAAVIFGVYRTDPQDAPAPPRTTRRSSTDLVTVDQGSLITAERLVRMPITPRERSFAGDALRLADQDMDLAFAQAVRSTTNQKRQVPPEARTLEVQLQKAQRTLEADQAQVKDLTAAVAKATPSTVQGTHRSSQSRPGTGSARSGRSRRCHAGRAACWRRSAGPDSGDDPGARGRVAELRQLRITVTPEPTTHGLINHLSALQASIRRSRS